MNSIKINILIILLFSIIITNAQIEKFQPNQENATVEELWRLTNEPAYRDWSLYHSTRCFSPDGRYIVYIHFGVDPAEIELSPKSELESEDLYYPYGTSNGKRLVLYDLYKDKEVDIDFGKDVNNPKWANKHNWLFFTRARGTNNELMWLDVKNKEITKIAEDLRIRRRATDYQDRWVYGTRTDQNGNMKAVRARIKKNARVEPLKGDWTDGGNLLYVNPNHPVIVSRDNSFKQHYFATKSWKQEGALGVYNIPFMSRHYFSCDLEGGNRSTPLPEMQGAHFSWNGDGSYFLAGNGPFRGWKWDEPRPSNLHLIGGNVRTSDPSPCGRSGRWISGSSNGPLWLLDTKTGDGYSYLKSLSELHDSEDFSYCYGSGLHDNDATGSPDGTKIAFVTNYDLKDGPVTTVTGKVSGVTGEKIPVASTKGFPEKGRLSIQNEIISYKSKSKTSFNEITRNVYNTQPVVKEILTPKRRKEFEERPVDLRQGQIVTSFDNRIIPEKEWEHLPLPAKIKEKYDDLQITPLLRQRQTDIYMAVVRLPDRPFLREFADKVELIPGKNHWEIRGYNIYQEGQKISDKPISNEETVTLKPGQYTATAVEWSGLESEKSHEIQIDNSKKLLILDYKPADFSWNESNWFVNGKEIPEKEARGKEMAIKKTSHIYEGLISKEWYNWGQKVKHFDVSIDNGEPTRKLYYKNGKLYKREYHHRSGWHATTEYFNSDGQIVESIYYNRFKSVENSQDFFAEGDILSLYYNRPENDEKKEYRHWWYEDHIPVRCVRNGVEYYRVDDVWEKSK